MRFLICFQQGAETIVVHGFLYVRIDYLWTFSFDWSVPSSSTSSTPRGGCGVVVGFRIDVRPSHLSGIAFRSSKSSAFASGPTVCGASESGSHPAPTSEKDLQVWFVVEPVLGSFTVCLNDLTTR